MADEPPRKLATLLAQGLIDPAAEEGALVPPIQPSTTFARGPDYALISEDLSYGRADNPTTRRCERLLARLESDAPEAEALLFSSGMAGAAAILQALAPGDRIAAPHVMYWGLRERMRAFCRNWGLGLDLFDATEPDALAAALKAGETKLLWLETPTNPTWDVIDIAAAAEAARALGIRTVVDSTVATPLITRPLALGADLVFHSATKYLNGHADVLAGVVVTARPDDFWAKLVVNREGGGGVLGPFEAWLLHRGLRSLALRVERASATALHLARSLEGHPKLSAVLYPGLPGHPGHEVARRQMTGGFGGMLSLRLAGGAEAALEVVRRVRVFQRATSLGGTESLIEHRASIEGAASPVPPDLLRLSVGIEDPGDLLSDLEAALAAT